MKGRPIADYNDFDAGKTLGQPRGVAKSAAVKRAAGAIIKSLKAPEPFVKRPISLSSVTIERF
jgi:hypothetical protein